jgi:nucleotide-binding universal stress UspA family protein
VDTKVSTSHMHASQQSVAPIVVGVDDDGRSTSAVVWAAEEAEHTSRPIRLVTVHGGPPGAEDPQATHGLAALARRLTLTQVSFHVVSGSPAAVLLDESEGAGLVVLGRRGRGNAQRLLLGSTSLAVSGRSSAPVVVVPEPWIQPSMSSAPVVVGVSAPDLTSTDHPEPTRDSAVLAFAVERSKRLRVPLIVVSAWELPAAYAWSAADVHAWRQRYGDALEARLAPLREQHPELEVVTRNVVGLPHQALLDASQVSQLVVVGQHLGHQLGRLGVGSTTAGVLNHATRPVAVVPLGLPTATDRERVVDRPAWAPMF